jgi:hypothetical protein
VEADVDTNKRLANYMDLSFDAASDVTYKCHLYVGGCCQETITWYLQGTDMASNSNRFEPGAKSYIGKGISPAAKSLPKKHADHGGAKAPTYWEWRTIELPRYSAGGIKKIRVISNVQGFALAFAVITSDRFMSRPPTLEEVRQLLKNR